MIFPFVRTCDDLPSVRPNAVPCKSLDKSLPEQLFKCKNMKSTRPSVRLSLAGDRASELADVFRLLGDPSRLRIVIACLSNRVSVTKLADELGLSISLVSHHLRLLRAARIVRSQRLGKHVFYRAADEHIRRVITDMLEHVAEPDDQEEERS